jgi:putative transposase
MAIDLKLIDKLLADYKKPEDILGENGLLKQLTKALLERAMQAEMTDHLGYEKHDPAGNNSGNSRNGGTTKTLKGDFGEMPLETPRDRNGSYEPKIIGKGQTRFTGFDDKIISMYARGMSTRDLGTPGRDLQSGSESDADLQRHRRGDGRGKELAEPAVGCGVSDRVLGRLGGEDSRDWARP